MVTEVVMPQLGESVTEGTIVKWLVTPGTKVGKYQPLCEIQTDKVTAEVPSSTSGIVKKHIAVEGQTVPVGELICLVEGIDLVEEIDLIEEMTKIESGERIDQIEKLNKIDHQDISGHKSSVSHSWMMIEVDVTDLVNYRNEIKSEFAMKQGLKLTYLPFFIRAVVTSLKKYPTINSVWSGNQILVRQDIPISIVVAANNQLYTPVIRNADQLSVLGLAKSIQDLVSSANKASLTMQDQEGGSFTLMNTGVMGLIESQLDIYYPQTTMLSIERITDRPVIIKDMFAVRSIVNLCMSYDKRVHDALTCSHFLQKVKHELENKNHLIPLY